MEATGARQRNGGRPTHVLDNSATGLIATRIAQKKKASPGTASLDSTGRDLVRIVDGETFIRSVGVGGTAPNDGLRRMVSSCQNQPSPGQPARCRTLTQFDR